MGFLQDSIKKMDALYARGCNLPERYKECKENLHRIGRDFDSSYQTEENLRHDWATSILDEPDSAPQPSVIQKIAFWLARNRVHSSIDAVRCSLERQKQKFERTVSKQTAKAKRVLATRSRLK